MPDHKRASQQAKAVRVWSSRKACSAAWSGGAGQQAGSGFRAVRPLPPHPAGTACQAHLLQRQRSK